MSQIKSRLKVAYENVEFYASDTWVHSSHAYQQANQELYVRECKARDALIEEHTRPRTVQDRIPQSRLAQYANYEYNESRELCYASNATNISFYYPCMYKRGSIKEPWMIPEIEQLFIWFSYPPDFNIFDLMRLEELTHLDEQEKFRVGKRSSCNWHDFHEIYPIFYKTLERTPGKSRFTSSSPVCQADLLKFLPSQLKILTFEDMILRMKITSDKIKYLWCQHSQSNLEPLPVEKNLKIVKSPLALCLPLDDKQKMEQQNELRLATKRNVILENRTLKKFDFGQLQYLADSIRNLETLIINSTRNVIGNSSSSDTCNDSEVPETLPKTEAPPTRRLYSAVLQGLKADKNISSSTDVTPTSTSPAKEQNEPTLSTTSVSSSNVVAPFCYTDENSETIVASVQKSSPFLPRNQTCSPPFQWMQQSFTWDSNNTQTKSYTHLSQEHTKLADAQFNTPSPKIGLSQRNEVTSIPKLTNTSSNTTITTFYTDACTSNLIHNSPNVSYSPNLSNVSGFSTSAGYIGNTYANNNNMCFGASLYNNNGYINNSYFNSQYTTNFQNTTYTGATISNNLYVSGTYQSNQVTSLNSRNVLPVFNRQPFPSSQVHIPPTHAMLLFQHNRPSATAYSVASQPYIFFPSTAPQPPPQTPPAPPPPPRQNQRWTPATHYVRASTLQSYHIPLTQQQPLTQHWGVQNQSIYGASSSQQTVSCSQQFVDSAQTTRTRSKLKKNNPSHVSFPLYKGRSRSPEGNLIANESLDNVEISSNVTGTYPKITTGSDIAISVPILKKPLLVRTIASTSSVNFRKVKPLSENTNVEKRSSAAAFKNENENSSVFSSDSEGSHTLLPVSATLSEELERQALEQYENSNENFYQELERQAEEQYDADHSENLEGPPMQNRFFGGLTIYSTSLIIKNYLILFFIALTY